RDEIGLVRAIAVKERSSSKRKELFKTIQTRSQADPAVIAKQMVLDMKVRWSSTFAMLKRGYQLRKATTLDELFAQEVNKFVFEISQEESGEKSKKLAALRLEEEEWERVELFVHILKSAEKAQHAFSADMRSTLHLAIPALEQLHTTWSKRATTAKYARFWSALNEALEKVNEYYEKTSTSNVYTFAMVLDPRKKLAYFTKNWDKELQAAALANMEETFQQRYLELHANKAAQTPALFSQQPQAPDKSGLRELTPDGDEDEPKLAEAHLDPTKPWRDEFQSYLDARESVPEGMTTIEWWGHNYHRYPVWGSLARDYLAIMASSVSSERAFSSAGITISKRRNRLKGDLVEALQVLKCLMCRELLFREPEILDEEEWEMGPGEDTVKDQMGWDCFLDDAVDNYEADVDMDD
ncbi:ribonuclease H-like domain-containing protein, partial [Mycena olivaceomarginata]